MRMSIWSRESTVPSRRRNWRRLFRISAGAVVVAGLLRWMHPAAPTSLGVRNGQLRQCPDSPNCVSSTSTDPRHAIEPLAFQGTRREALQQLEALVRQMPLAHVVESGDQYLHVEFRSRMLRFVDDVEFFAPLDAHHIEVRSGSRVGYSDFGVNRDRIEMIRQLFNESFASDGS